jgi:hypothetical protein
LVVARVYRLPGLEDGEPEARRTIASAARKAAAR